MQNPHSTLGRPDQAVALLKQFSVVGDNLTPGKLAEAIGLDYQRHQRAWASAWLR